jgi:CMP-N-acetylneuraminic acid synthetase
MKIIAVIPARYANTISAKLMQDLGGKQHFKNHEAKSTRLFDDVLWSRIQI